MEDHTWVHNPERCPVGEKEKERRGRRREGGGDGLLQMKRKKDLKKIVLLYIKLVGKFALAESHADGIY